MSEPPPQITWAPLHWAAENGHVSLVRLLVKAGAYKNAPKEVREGRSEDGKAVLELQGNRT